jgi:hypothetical protein
MGAAGNVAKIAISLQVHDRKAEARDAIIGEASYGLGRDAQAGEFAISLSDGWPHPGAWARLCYRRCNVARSARGIRDCSARH